MWIGIGLWPFPTGVFASSLVLCALRRKIEFGVCKKMWKCYSHQFSFCCFCDLVHIWDKRNFSYNQKRMEIDWIYVFLIWCPLEIRDWYISAALHHSSDCVWLFWILQKSYLNQRKILATFSSTLEYLRGLKALSERSCKLKGGALFKIHQCLKHFCSCVCPSVQASLCCVGGGRGGGEVSTSLFFILSCSRDHLWKIILL